MRSRPKSAANNIKRPQKQPIKRLVTGNTLALRLTRRSRLMLNCSNIFFGISDHFAGRIRTVQRLTTSEPMVWYNPRSVHCAILSMTSPTWLGRCHTHGIRRMGSSKQGKRQAHHSSSITTTKSSYRNPMSLNMTRRWASRRWRWPHHWV